MARRDFSKGRRDAVLRFVKRPARCCTAIFQEAGMMPRRNFFKRPARCSAAIFQEAGAMPHRDFSRGRRDAAPQSSRLLETGTRLSPPLSKEEERQDSDSVRKG